MGFLMGAYGKLMAGKLVRDLQFQLMSVTRRAQRITKEIGDKEKMYQAQERNMKQQMQSQRKLYSVRTRIRFVCLPKRETCTLSRY